MSTQELHGRAPEKKMERKKTENHSLDRKQGEQIFQNP
jgi:hypothetical protein